MGFVRLFLLYAILIFAKKAPDMIKDMLKIKGDNIGLKGLNIKNKMGEAALVGKHVKKGMTGLEGKTKGVLGGGLSGFMNTKGGLRKRLKGGIKGSVTGSKNAGKAAMEKGDSKGLFTGGYNKVKPAARGGRPTIWDRAKDGGTAAKNWIQDKGAPIGLRGYGSLEIVRANETAKLRANLSKLVGGHKANKMMDLLIKKHGKNGVIDLSNADVFEAVKTDLKKLSECFDAGTITTVFTTGASVGSHIVPGLSARDVTDALGSRTIDMDSLLQKRNLLDAREKMLAKIQDFNNEIMMAQQSGDSTRASNIAKKREAAINSAIADGLFSPYPALGVVEITANTTTKTGDVYENLSDVSKKNGKALEATEKDIAARDEVEKSDSSKS